MDADVFIYPIIKNLCKDKMNEDDYDEDGNNIVPCPICLDQYCSSKENGICPEEKEFVKSLGMKLPDNKLKNENIN